MLDDLEPRHSRRVYDTTTKAHNMGVRRKRMTFRNARASGVADGSAANAALRESSAPWARMRMLVLTMSFLLMACARQRGSTNPPEECPVMACAYEPCPPGVEPPAGCMGICGCAGMNVPGPAMMLTAPPAEPPQPIEKTRAPLGEPED